MKGGHIALSVIATGAAAAAAFSIWPPTKLTLDDGLLETISDQSDRPTPSPKTAGLCLHMCINIVV